jgi:hypothetical protein
MRYFHDLLSWHLSFHFVEIKLRLPDSLIDVSQFLASMLGPVAECDDLELLMLCSATADLSG